MIIVWQKKIESKKKMKTSELRLGNWMLLDWENTYRRVNLNTLCYIARSEKLGKKHPFKPITLTEEILLKCGFKFNDNSHRQISKPSIFIEELRYVYKINDFEIRLFKGRYYYNNIEIKYLHQLQNLYFALTNQELNIEL